ncbi:MAG: DUF438 domain-containing protein [Anaerolineae bacterium]|jgi:DUF438 domain-containing protein
MTANRVEELTEVLRRLTGGEDPEQVKKEAEGIVREITPQELSLAEQQLIQEGVDPQELRHLCEVHLRVLSEEVHRFRASLPKGHPVNTLMAEHEVILETLAQLEEVNQAVQQTEQLTAEQVEQLEQIATHLVEAESHHQREEEALFPRVEERGVTGPPRIMRLEHDELRQRKHALLELARSATRMPLSDFRARLNELAPYLVLHLRDHIFKEDNILYPTAVEVVTEPAVWEEIKARCDEIGYCCFTPAEPSATSSTS